MISIKSILFALKSIFFIISTFCLCALNSKTNNVSSVYYPIGINTVLIYLCNFIYILYILYMHVPTIVSSNPNDSISFMPSNMPSNMSSNMSSNSESQIHNIRFNSLLSNIIMFIIALFASSYDVFSVILFDHIVGISLIMCLVSLFIHYIFVYWKNANVNVKKHILKYHIQIPYILLLSVATIKKELVTNGMISGHNILMNILLWLSLYTKCKNEINSYEKTIIKNKNNDNIIPYHDILYKLCLIPIIKTFHLYWFVSNKIHINSLTYFSLLMYLIFSFGCIVYKNNIQIWLTKKMDIIWDITTKKLYNVMMTLISIIPIQLYEIYYLSIFFQLYKVITHYDRYELLSTFTSTSDIINTNINVSNNIITQKKINEDIHKHSQEKIQTESIIETEKIDDITHIDDISNDTDNDSESTQYSIKYHRVNNEHENTIKKIMQKYTDKNTSIIDY